MKKTGILAVVTLAGVLSAACSSNGINLTPRPSFGAVIKFEVMPGSAEKYGINAVTDEGRKIFGHAGLRAPEILGRGGGTLSYVGAGVPKWVRVTWRTPIYGKLTTSTGKVVDTLDFGEIIGDYTIQIASHIPPEVLKYASGGKNRALYLIFRLKDDGVLFAWSVQETVRAPNGGTGYVYSLFGGDFSCDQAGMSVNKERCTAGYLKDAPWYNPVWTFI